MPLETPITETAVQTRSVIVPHLPNEVLIKILSHVPLNPDLASAALVSRNFTALVQGFLYRFLQLDLRCSEEEIQSYYSSGETPHTFERFSRLINKLSADCELSNQTIALSLTVPRRLWYTLGNHYRLMQCLPNLRHVTLRPPPLRTNVPIGLYVSSVLLDFQLLSDHHNPMFDNPNTDGLGEWTADTISRHLWLPNLHKLQVENPKLHEFRVVRLPRYHLSRASSSGYSTVKDLRLIDCHEPPSGDFFESLLAQVVVLKRFVFVSNNSSIFEGLEEHVRPSIRGISRGLIRHMASVEEVVLSPSDGTYGTLLLREWYFDHCFTNLRSVALPKCLLVQDIARRSQCLLPSTVEEVQIQFTMSAEHYEESDQAAIAQQKDTVEVEWLAKAKLVSLPQLKRVIWWYQTCELDGSGIGVGVKENPFHGSLPQLRRLRGQFSDVGVNFEWVFVRLFRDTPFGRRLDE